MKRIRYFALLFLILALAIDPVHARDYRLEEATADVVVRPDGTVQVTESISYFFSGTYNEVYRQVYPPPGGSIQNIRITCREKPCGQRVDMISGGYELVGVLPQPTPERVTFVVSYDYLGGLKVYSDVSELHYKLWGEEWDKHLEKMTAVIYLPGGTASDVRYWLHPDGFTKGVRLEEDRIVVETFEIPSNNWYEVRAVFPRIENPDPRFVSLQKGPGLERILEVEGAYQEKQAIAEKLYMVVWLLAIVTAAVPFYIYHRFGREPKIDYQALYEREPPYESKPAAVNTIMRGAISKPDINAFVATVMDLAYKGFLSLKDVKAERTYLGVFTRSGDDILIELEDKEKTGLLDFELDALNFLWAFSKEGRLYWNKFRQELGGDDRFYKFITRWNRQVERHIKVERLFISTGNHLLMGFGIASLLILIAGAVGIANYYPLNEFPGISKAVLPGIVMLAVAIGSLLVSIINEKGAGRFTPEGRLYYQRWNRFQRYLTDFSALKEHPPGSVKLWDFYMVYAVALGVAEKAIENMGLLMPKEVMKESTFHSFYFNPVFFSGFDGAYQSSNPSASTGGFGGVGGVGGGFGGGGGGAR